MELKLQREILRLNPELTVAQIKAKAEDVFTYWIENCLEDVLEADNA